MENLKFDLTNEEGIRKSILLLERESELATVGVFKKINMKPFFEFAGKLLNRFVDLFDSSKKLEIQMKLVKETIEMCRKLGAKRVEIIIDKRNYASFKAHIEEIDATAKASNDTGGKMTFIVDFPENMTSMDSQE